MILLPRGNPVKERIDPARVHLPQALGKLRDGGFTGYLRFDTRTGTGILIFEGGRLISALFEDGSGRSTGGEALARIFERALAGLASLDIYKLSTELALSVHALLHGDVLYRGQELKLIDIKALLAKLKEDRISGCLRIYTDQRIALIFYREGSPLGFFHDGSTAIETRADTSMSVARLPGAKIDVLTYAGEDEADLEDLQAVIDLDALWESARQKVQQLRRRREAEASRGREQAEKERRAGLLELLRGAAREHLGKIGGSLVDKAAEKTLAPTGAVTEKDLEPFYDNLGQAAKLVAGPRVIKAMVEHMKEGAGRYLRTD